MEDLIRRSDAIAILEDLQSKHLQFCLVPFRIAIEKVQAIPSADRPQGWIPCSERLPNKKEVVLITNDKGNVRCGRFRYTDGKYWVWKGNTLETVLAWMPLPKPYKGADDGEDIQSADE